MGKFREKLGKIFAEDLSRYSVLLPDEAVANPALFEQQLRGTSPGRQRARDVAEKMRAVHPQEVVALELPLTAQRTDEQQLYINNPGHNPTVDN